MIDPDRRPYIIGVRVPAKAPLHHAARRPRLRWPTEMRLIPLTCSHCGSRVLVTDYPTADFPTVDISCYLCSRDVCELVIDAGSLR